MALARERLDRDWPAKRVLAQLAAAGVDVCVYTEALRARCDLTSAECNNATKTLLGRQLIARCYYVDGPRKKGGYKLMPAGKAAYAGGVGLKCGPVAPRPAAGVRAKAWAAMRIKGKFTLDDLELLCATGGEADIRDNLAKYAAALLKSGHVLRIGKPRLGSYYLARNTGPEAPAWSQRRRQVYDPNTGVTHGLA